MSRIHAKFFARHCWVPLAFALAVSPVASRSEEGGLPPSPEMPVSGQPSSAAVPVAQVLVPEGYFAMQLVGALKLGQPQDDAAAETLLSGVGIEPKNGWIADYPVTPAVIGDVEQSVAVAAQTAKLGMDKAQALKLTAEVKARLGLDVTPGSAKPDVPAVPPGHSVIYKYTDKNGEVHYSNDPSTIPPEYRDKAVIVGQAINPTPSAGPPPENGYPPNYDPNLINQYYYNDGPPVLTYYPPPSPYDYLYSWSPYPFWYSGLYFSGYFILRDFHRHVFADGNSRLVSNHWAGGHANTLGQSNPAAGIPTGNRGPSLQNFNSPQIQSSARTILGLGQNHSNPAQQYAHAPSTGMARPAEAAGVARNGGVPSMPAFGGRAFQQPAVQQRYSAPAAPQVYYPRTFSQGGGGGHYYGHQGGGGGEGFHGGGGFSGHSGGGGHGGGGHR